MESSNNCFYFSNYKTFKSAEVASKYFIDLNERFKNKEEDKSFFPEIKEIKNKMENTLKIQMLKNKFTNSEKNSDFIYRLEWMIVHLNSLMFKNQKINFEDDCINNFNTKVDLNYLENKIENEKILRSLLQGKENLSLYEELKKYKESIMIPKEEYEETFKKLVNEVLNLVKIDELNGAKLDQNYIDDINMTFEATCEPVSKKLSKMIVNIARPISYDKAQQLAAHELTHHFQFILMEDLIEKFPEMDIIKDSLALSMLLEGGAELAVDLIYDKETRFNSLRNLLSKKFSDNDISKILEIESIIWKGSWPIIIDLSKKYLNNEITKDELIHFLQEKAYKPHNSWPNADFIEEYRAYVQSYGWGRELIARYLDSNNSLNMKGYIEFMKRPLTPQRMQQSLDKNKLL